MSVEVVNRIDWYIVQIVEMTNDEIPSVVTNSQTYQGYIVVKSSDFDNECPVFGNDCPNVVVCEFLV